jgi:hypothetical protein
MAGIAAVYRRGLLRSACASGRRRGALSLFRLASAVLHTTTNLYERDMIPRIVVKAGLSISSCLETGAAALYPCLGRNRHQNRQRETGQ